MMLRRKVDWVDVKALKGIIVVDFTTMVAGAGTTRLLADCGATVIKIEAPEGDMMRAFDEGKVSLNFGLYNAGKQSIVLDLKNPEGVALALELIRKADIVVENFRPGAMKKFGLGYDDARAVRPDVIYCSVSGFGQYGPLAARAAYAPVAHAFSGFDMLLAQMENPEAPPLQNGIMLADTLTCVYAFSAIQTALVHRLRTGAGAHIDVTMIESMMHMVALQFIKAQEGARTGGDYRASVHPPYKTSDGYINIPVSSVPTQHALCRVIGLEAWTQDPELQSLPGLRRRRGELYAAVAEWTVGRTSAECDAAMTRAGVPCAIYYLPHELMEHPHILARGALERVEANGGRFTVLNPPFQFNGKPLRAGAWVPDLGGDTAAVLRDVLDLDDAAVAQLVSNGAFGNPSSKGAVSVQNKKA